MKILAFGIVARAVVGENKVAQAERRFWDLRWALRITIVTEKRGDLPQRHRGKEGKGNKGIKKEVKN
jgi:hypothetical protein